MPIDREMAYNAHCCAPIEIEVSGAALDSQMVTFSDFQANADSCVRQVLETGGPLLISNSDTGHAALLSAEAYAELKDRAELFYDILNANDELDAGLGVSHEVALASALARLAG